MAESRVLVSKDAVTYYEALQQFRVAEFQPGGHSSSGCGALHVMWEDLAEIRTLAVRPGGQGRGCGVGACSRPWSPDARGSGVQRLFCLTFEVDFFTRHGFEAIEGQAVEPEVYAELCAPTTRAWRSSSTSSGSSRTPSATPGCSGTSEPGRSWSGRRVPGPCQMC